MTFDIPHMIATVLIIFIVVWGFDQTSMFKNMDKKKKTLIQIGTLFVAILILNLFWPYGAGG